GVDISNIGISMARGDAPPNCDFRVADLKHLPFDENSFDFAFSQSVLEHVVGWEETLAELRRVLRPGGELLIRLGNGGVRGKPPHKALRDYFLGSNRVLKLKPSFELEYGDGEAHMTNFDVQEIPSDVLVRELRTAGFTIQFFSTRTHT